MDNLLYIGPAPQNIGGISIHIRRLAGMIKDKYEIDYVDEGHVCFDRVFNLRSGNIFKYLAKVRKADIIHIHSGMWLLRCMHIIVCKLLLRKKVIVTIHRDPNIEPYSRFTKCLLRMCNYAILVNKEGYYSMKCESNCKYILLPAFLPPSIDDEPPLPEGIIQWIRHVKSQKESYLMCSNAWSLVMHNGEDLYGLDLCIDAMIKLGKTYYLFFIVASNSNQKERMSYYKEKIKENDLDNNILIWEEPASFVRLIQHCDLVLRTTNTDGDAISIREALYYGKPVLASDVVRRPDGVSLFKNRNIDDLAFQIQIIAKDKNKMTLNRDNRIDYKSLYCNMYNN